jgi:hypothetical protein
MELAAGAALGQMRERREARELAAACRPFCLAVIAVGGRTDVLIRLQEG